MTVPCASCGRELGPVERRRAFLSLFVFGDEEIRSWFFCETCRAWTIEEYSDRFMGETSVILRGPFPEGSCEADVALAQSCPDPGSKWCECPAHRKLGP